MLSTELVPLSLDLDPVPAVPTVATVPVLPVVGALDLYAALLADARKPTTRRAREQDAADLTRFLATVGPAEACALFVVGGAPQANAIATAYTRSMLDKGLSPATINRRVSTLRRLVKLGRRFEVITWGLDVDSQRVESYRDSSGPGRSGWLRLLDMATKAAAKTDKGKRDLAIVRLLHDQALRRAEVTALDLADVDLEAGRLLVMGKGKGEKAPMTLNAPTVLALSHWLDARGLEPGPLFVRMDKARPKGELARLDGDGIHLAVRQLGRKARLTRPVRPHGLRHEAVTRVLQLTNGNIDAGQKFARHASPVTTQKYNDNRADVAGAMARLLGDDS
jgi:integrase/recombinase XerC